MRTATYSWSNSLPACRPHHEELHGWANQLLLSKSVLLEALQQQVEKQAAMTELIRKIREPDAPNVSEPAAFRIRPIMLEPPNPSASLSIDRDFAQGKVTAQPLAAHLCVEDISSCQVLLAAFDPGERRCAKPCLLE